MTAAKNGIIHKETPLQIGELARRVGVSTPTVRYYEEIGLLPQPERAANGYRIYHKRDVERLRFVLRSRTLDFSLEEIGEILDLREGGSCPCGYVLAQIEEKLVAIDERIEELQRLREELTGLYAEARNGSTTTDVTPAEEPGTICAIIEGTPGPAKETGRNCCGK